MATCALTILVVSSVLLNGALGFFGDDAVQSSPSGSGTYKYSYDAVPPGLTEEVAVFRRWQPRIGEVNTFFAHDFADASIAQCMDDNFEVFGSCCPNGNCGDQAALCSNMCKNLIHKHMWHLDMCNIRTDSGEHEEDFEDWYSANVCNGEGSCMSGYASFSCNDDNSVQVDAYLTSDCSDTSQWGDTTAPNQLDCDTQLTLIQNITGVDTDCACIDEFSRKSNFGLADLTTTIDFGCVEQESQEAFDACCPNNCTNALIDKCNYQCEYFLEMDIYSSGLCGTENYHKLIDFDVFWRGLENFGCSDDTCDDGWDAPWKPSCSDQTLETCYAELKTTVSTTRWEAFAYTYLTAFAKKQDLTSPYVDYDPDLLNFRTYGSSRSTWTFYGNYRFVEWWQAGWTEYNENTVTTTYTSFWWQTIYNRRWYSFQYYTIFNNRHWSETTTNGAYVVTEALIEKAPGRHVNLGPAYTWQYGVAASSTTTIDGETVYLKLTVGGPCGTTNTDDCFEIDGDTYAVPQYPQLLVGDQYASTDEEMQCVDKSYYALRDDLQDTCGYYEANPDACGAQFPENPEVEYKYFSSSVDCCACGGGNTVNKQIKVQVDPATAMITFDQLQYGMDTQNMKAVNCHGCWSTRIKPRGYFNGNAYFKGMSKDALNKDFETHSRAFVEFSKLKSMYDTNNDALNSVADLGVYERPGLEMDEIHRSAFTRLFTSTVLFPPLTENGQWYQTNFAQAKTDASRNYFQTDCSKPFAKVQQNPRNFDGIVNKLSDSFFTVVPSQIGDDDYASFNSGNSKRQVWWNWIVGRDRIKVERFGSVYNNDWMYAQPVAYASNWAGFPQFKTVSNKEQPSYNVNSGAGIGYSGSVIQTQLTTGQMVQVWATNSILGQARRDAGWASGNGESWIQLTLTKGLFTRGGQWNSLAQASFTAFNRVYRYPELTPNGNSPYGSGTSWAPWVYRYRISKSTYDSNGPLFTPTGQPQIMTFNLKVVRAHNPREGGFTSLYAYPNEFWSNGGPTLGSYENPIEEYNNEIISVSGLWQERQCLDLDGPQYTARRTDSNWDYQYVYREADVWDRLNGVQYKEYLRTAVLVGRWITPSQSKVMGSAMPTFTPTSGLETYRNMWEGAKDVVTFTPTSFRQTRAGRMTYHLLNVWDHRAKLAVPEAADGFNHGRTMTKWFLDLWMDGLDSGSKRSSYVPAPTSVTVSDLSVNTDQYVLDLNGRIIETRPRYIGQGISDYQRWFYFQTANSGLSYKYYDCDPASDPYYKELILGYNAQGGQEVFDEIVQQIDERVTLFDDDARMPQCFNQYAGYLDYIPGSIEYKWRQNLVTPNADSDNMITSRLKDHATWRTAMTQLTQMQDVNGVTWQRATDLTQSGFGPDNRHWDIQARKFQGQQVGFNAWIWARPGPCDEGNKCPFGTYDFGTYNDGTLQILWWLTSFTGYTETTGILANTDTYEWKYPNHIINYRTQWEPFTGDVDNELTFTYNNWFKYKLWEWNDMRWTTFCSTEEYFEFLDCFKSKACVDEELFMDHICNGFDLRRKGCEENADVFSCVDHPFAQCKDIVMNSCYCNLDGSCGDCASDPDTVDPCDCDDVYCPPSIDLMGCDCAPEECCGNDFSAGETDIDCGFETSWTVTETETSGYSTSNVLSSQWVTNYTQVVDCPTIFTTPIFWFRSTTYLYTWDRADYVRYLSWLSTPETTIFPQSYDADGDSYALCYNTWKVKTRVWEPVTSTVVLTKYHTWHNYNDIPFPFTTVKGELLKDTGVILSTTQTAEGGQKQVFGNKDIRGSANVDVNTFWRSQHLNWYDFRYAWITWADWASSSNNGIFNQYIKTWFKRTHMIVPYTWITPVWDTSTSDLSRQFHYEVRQGEHHVNMGIWKPQTQLFAYDFDHVLISQCTYSTTGQCADAGLDKNNFGKRSTPIPDMDYDSVPRNFDAFWKYPCGLRQVDEWEYYRTAAKWENVMDGKTPFDPNLHVNLFALEGDFGGYDPDVTEWKYRRDSRSYFTLNREQLVNLDVTYSGGYWNPSAMTMQMVPISWTIGTSNGVIQWTVSSVTVWSLKPSAQLPAFTAVAANAPGSLNSWFYTLNGRQEMYDFASTFWDYGDWIPRVWNPQTQNLAFGAGPIGGGGVRTKTMLTRYNAVDKMAYMWFPLTVGDRSISKTSMRSVGIVGGVNMDQYFGITLSLGKGFGRGPSNTANGGPCSWNSDFANCWLGNPMLTTFDMQRIWDRQSDRQVRSRNTLFLGNDWDANVFELKNNLGEIMFDKYLTSIRQYWDIEDNNQQKLINALGTKSTVQQMGRTTFDDLDVCDGEDYQKLMDIQYSLYYIPRGVATDNQASALMNYGMNYARVSPVANGLQSKLQDTNMELILTPFNFRLGWRSGPAQGEAAYDKNPYYWKSTYQQGNKFPDATDGVSPANYLEHTYRMPYIYYAPERPALTQVNLITGFQTNRKMNGDPVSSATKQYWSAMNLNRMMSPSAFKQSGTSFLDSTWAPRYALQFKDSRFATTDTGKIAGLVKQYKTQVPFTLWKWSAGQSVQYVTFNSQVRTVAIEFSEIESLYTSEYSEFYAVNPLWAEFGDYQKWQYQWPLIYGKPTAKKTDHGNVGYDNWRNTRNYQGAGSMVKFADMRVARFFIDDPKYQHASPTWWNFLYHNTWLQVQSQPSLFPDDLDTFSDGQRFGNGGYDWWSGMTGEEYISHGLFTKWWKQQTAIYLDVPWYFLSTTTGTTVITPTTGDPYTVSLGESNWAAYVNTITGQFVRSTDLTLNGNAVGWHNLYTLPHLPLLASNTADFTAAYGLNLNTQGQWTNKYWPTPDATSKFVYNEAMGWMLWRATPSSRVTSYVPFENDYTMGKQSFGTLTTYYQRMRENLNEPGAWCFQCDNSMFLTTGSGKYDGTYKPAQKYQITADEADIYWIDTSKVYAYTEVYTTLTTYYAWNTNEWYGWGWSSKRTKWTPVFTTTYWTTWSYITTTTIYHTSWWYKIDDTNVLGTGDCERIDTMLSCWMRTIEKDCPSYVSGLQDGICKTYCRDFDGYKLSEAEKEMYEGCFGYDYEFCVDFCTGHVPHIKQDPCDDDSSSSIRGVLSALLLVIMSAFVCM